ncbi:unnamed protein product [Pedinophyceae sp. YPF-701]|nr:unnamed protein product [Pedinophyceae sp. YPF-701]
MLRLPSVLIALLPLLLALVARRCGCRAEFAQQGHFQARTRDIAAETHRVVQFLPVFWINLRASEDRRAFQHQQLFNVRQTRVEAVEPTWEPYSRFVVHSPASHDFASESPSGGRVWSREEVRGLPQWGGPGASGPAGALARTRVAALLSHLRAVRAAYDSGEPLAMIMEDAADFKHAPIWTKTLPEILSAAPDGCEALLLHNAHAFVSEVFAPAGTLYVPAASQLSYGAMAYVLTRSAMHALLTAAHGTDFESRDEASALVYLPTKWYAPADFVMDNAGDGAYVYMRPLLDRLPVPSTVDPSHPPLSSSYAIKGTAHVALYFALRWELHRRAGGSNALTAEQAASLDAREVVRACVPPLSVVQLQPRSVARVLRAVSRELGIDPPLEFREDMLADHPHGDPRVNMDPA